MNVKELIYETSFNVLTGNTGLENEITCACVGDLLSHIMARGQKGSVWVTVRTHLNVVAVAAMNEFSCIIVSDSVKVPEETVEAAVREGISILASEKTAFEVCGILSKLMI